MVTKRLGFSGRKRVVRRVSLLSEVSCGQRLQSARTAVSGAGGCRRLGSREAAKPRSREGQGRRVFFDYEYEYRPPGRTEYEYEVSFF
jgi:hypothetical protein